MARGRDLDARAPGRELQARERDRHEAGRVLAQERVVESRELVARPQPRDGVGAQRVAGERGDRRRLRSLAADVADRPAPSSRRACGKTS